MGRQNFGYGTPDFGDAVGGADEQIRFIDIDLSTARSKALGTMLEVFMSGTFIMIAQDAFDSEAVISAVKTVGKALMRLNRNTNSPILLRAGQQFQLGPFEKLYIENSAQAGKMMRLYFSTGPIILPFSSDISISGSTQVSDLVNGWGGSHFENALTVAVQTILAPASNVNGVKVRAVVYNLVGLTAIHADTAAPAAPGDVTKRLLWQRGAAAGFDAIDRLIPAGNGLFVSVASVAGSQFDLGYDVL